jgi:hypothetical protein
MKEENAPLDLRVVLVLGVVIQLSAEQLPSPWETLSIPFMAWTSACSVEVWRAGWASSQQKSGRNASTGLGGSSRRSWRPCPVFNCCTSKTLEFAQQNSGENTGLRLPHLAQTSLPPPPWGESLGWSVLTVPSLFSYLQRGSTDTY